jgi:hypothetical protein
MQGGNTQSYPAFPEIEAALGYNPARFLDQPQSVPDHICDTSPMATVQAFINGMDESETIRAWIEVEAALGRGENGGPRTDVADWLYDRREQIEEDTDAQSEATLSNHEALAHQAGEDETHADAGEDRDELTETLTEPDTPNETDAAVDATSADAGLAADGGTTRDPTCPVCQADLTREEIAGKTGYWCPMCEDFQESDATEVPA